MTMHQLRSILLTLSPQQLAIALESCAFVYVESYLQHTPPPEGTTPEEREALREAMIYSALIKALNTAAEVALELAAKPDTQPDPDAEAVAQAMAEAAILKAAGKTH